MAGTSGKRLPLVLIGVALFVIGMGCMLYGRSLIEEDMSAWVRERYDSVRSGAAEPVEMQGSALALPLAYGGTVCALGGVAMAIVGAIRGRRPRRG